MEPEWKTSFLHKPLVLRFQVGLFPGVNVLAHHARFEGFTHPFTFGMYLRWFGGCGSQTPTGEGEKGEAARKGGVQNLFGPWNLIVQGSEWCNFVIDILPCTALLTIDHVNRNYTPS